MGWNREEERKAGKALTIGGCVYGLIFSMVWCLIALSMDAGIMLLFGVPFAVFMGYRLVICVRMARGEKKNSGPEEPWNRPAPPEISQPAHRGGFCPYCGSAVQADFAYCPKCGRKQ